MLRDYELALSNYRLLSTDYKLDKAWKHYAGVQVVTFFLTVNFVYVDQSFAGVRRKDFGDVLKPNWKHN